MQGLTGRTAARQAITAIAIVGTGVMGLCCAMGAASAQSDPREVLLGVSKPGAASAAQLAENEAAQAYATAAAVLRNDSAGAAQRRLEQLVARYPDTATAALVRRELAQLYSAGNAAVQPPQRVALPASGGSYLGGGGIPSVLPEPISASRWPTEAQPVRKGFQRTEQEDFRGAAGDLVFFSEGNAELGARARKVLAAQADWLKKHPERTVVVEGHADEPNRNADSVAISAARADAVRWRLIDEGIAGNRITVVAHGATRRVALCSDDSCASQNRRVATTIVANATADVSR